MKTTDLTCKNYCIENVELWNEDGRTTNCTVSVRNGRVARIGKKEDSNKSLVIDGRGKVLMPAGVDAQVHTRVPGQLEKETPESVAKAAIAGGVACMLTMPNTNPVVDDQDSFALCDKLLSETESSYGVKTLISVAITVGQKGKKPVNFQRLADLGASAYTDDGVGVVDDDIMRAVFRASSQNGLPVLQHAEMPGHGAILAEGPVQKKLGIKPYPRSAEIEMVRRDLRLLAEYPEARYHVLHVSCKETVDLVQAAKSQGLRATCEVTPHHLFLCSDNIQDQKTSYKMNPPLRGAEDRAALQLSLAEGQIDFVSTDHAPHEDNLKGASFKTAAFGTLGLETSLRVLLALKKRGILSPERLVSVFASEPARFLNVADRYGAIAEGKSFYGVLVDNPDLDFEVTRDNLPGHCKNSCFLGQSLPGRIAYSLFGEHVHKLYI